MTRDEPGNPLLGRRDRVRLSGGADGLEHGVDAVGDLVHLTRHESTRRDGGVPTRMPEP